MPNKTEEYLALACKTADSFSRQWEHWAEFLITAARLYKYSYPDQLMIYAQRPDATACAEYGVWNNKMNRYVRRGSKGIALLDESGGYPRLHYVFDVSDTAPRRNALYPDLWQINESLKEPVRSMLAENYGIESVGKFHSQHIGLPGGSPICCDVLIVPCMRTADRLRPIFQTGTAGIRSPRPPFFHRGRSAGPRC